MLLSYIHILLQFFWLNAHPIHVAVSEMNYNTQQRTLEMSHKFFYDDLETTINKSYNVKLKLNTPQELPNADDYIHKYISTSFIVRQQGKVLPMTYVGREYEQDAVWVYYEITNAPITTNLLITNQLLMESFDDQSNLLHFQKQDYKKSLRFTLQDRVLELAY
ncbi:MAG: DUF6702 family protein [Thermoflexibacteraceae bacterium]|jgi:hypothetical protein